MARGDRKSNSSEVCEELGISETTLKRYRGMGCPHTKSGRGLPCLYNIEEVAAWMRENDLTGEVGRPTTQQSASMDEAMLRKTNAMADNWLSRNAKELRELLPASEVQRAWAKVAMRVRAQVLAVPDSAGPAMDGMTAVERISEMRKRLEEALEQLDSDSEPASEKPAA